MSNNLANNHLPPKPHFVVVPLMAQGHMIPMADLALLLARRGARVSLITTPVNALRLRAAADLAIASGLSFLLISLPSPFKSTAIPDGCENVDLIPSPDLFPLFFRSLGLMAEPLKSYLRSQPPSPTCIIADQCMPWTIEVSRSLSIPHFVFHGPSCLFLLCTLKLTKHNLYEKVTKNVEENFAVPELPQRIEVNKLTAQRFFDWPGMEDIMRSVQKAEELSDGIVLNTFYELEPWCVDEYRRSVGKNVWAVGPVCVVHEDVVGKAVRGNGNDYNDGVVRWLDQREKRSVLFVSFGSVARTRRRQLVEIGLGLEAAGIGFVWAVKEAEESEEMGKWFAGFEERNRGKGIVMRGWVPQMVILAHAAVGGFMTHGGWNSTLEAVAAGVPVITWPHFADQFLNERLVVEVVRAGVAVGVKLPSYFQAEGEEEAPVGRESVEMAVRRLMCGGVEAEGIRKRAWEIGEKARKAMEEGGSSYVDVGELIDYAVMLAENHRANGME